MLLFKLHSLATYNKITVYIEPMISHTQLLFHTFKYILVSFYDYEVRSHNHDIIWAVSNKLYHKGIIALEFVSWHYVGVQNLHLMQLFVF